MADLSGKIAIVTGAASGIGKAMAHAMGTHGATVLLADLNAEACRTVAASGGSARISRTNSPRAAPSSRGRPGPSPCQNGIFPG